MKKLLIYATLCFTICSIAFSQTDHQRIFWDRGYFVNGIRPALLGGAFSAISDDENALMYNPAGLSFQDGKFTIYLGAIVHPQDTTVNLIQREQTVKIRGVVSGTSKNKGMGLFLDHTTTIIGQNKNEKNHPLFAFGVSKKFGKKFAIGTSVKLAFPKYQSSTIEREETTIYSTGKGFGGGLNFGLMYKGKLLSVGIVLQDAFASKLNIDFRYPQDTEMETNTIQYEVPTKFRIGTALRIPNLPIIKYLIGDIIPTFEISTFENVGEVDNPEDDLSFNNVHIGLEAEFLRLGWLAHGTFRFGINHSAITDWEGNEFLLNENNENIPNGQLSHTSITLGLSGRVLIVDASIGAAFTFPTLEEGAYAGFEEDEVLAERRTSQIFISAGISF
ncbi:MAG: hypothetical protein ISR90_02825 [Candidatus Marinimicrobia bacterium]|nr:hypothetical protein [Candidatus Neomarinimicrobiota bacterium]MBL7022973.1 hypothetical protein [Candidatus Neomarinimicrobiota bacterium]MBL7108791.1 hypothetical protein [Candidatus Neomarinimicrobiota bacterium]